MAEYIDRDKLNKKKKYLFQTQGMPFPKSEYFIKVDDFWSIPTSDVIERSKIDKAIEEIQKERKIYLDMNDVDWLNGCDYVLEILKRNKGE